MFNPNARAVGTKTVGVQASKLIVDGDVVGIEVVTGGKFFRAILTVDSQ